MSLMCQVLAGQPSHVAKGLSSLASTDFQLQVPCYRLLESVPVMATRERLQSGVGWPRCLVGWPPSGPTGQWPLHATYLFWWKSNFPCNFLKSFNLAPMFLKLNKH
jgi:hypothetical protein